MFWIAVIIILLLVIPYAVIRARAWHRRRREVKAVARLIKDLVDFANSGVGRQ
jgi:hypothetical protein